MAATIRNPYALLKEEKPSATSSNPVPAEKPPAKKAKKANGTASPKTPKNKSSESVPVAAPVAAAGPKKSSSLISPKSSSRGVIAADKSAPRSASAQFVTLFKKFYLMFYNIAQAVGWTMILFFIVVHFAQGGTYQKLWPKIGHNLIIFQGLAFLEVIHAAVGLVPSSAVTTFIQIFSRILLAVLVVPNVPEVQSHWMVTTMVVAWCLVEMIRYPFYALSIFGKPPAWLTWLRYTAFWILYPTGGGSECGMLLLAAPFVAKSQLWRLTMPNKHNFAFDFAAFIKVFAYGYVIGLPYMMSHMVAQRRSALAKLAAEKDGKKD